MPGTPRLMAMLASVEAAASSALCPTATVAETAAWTSACAGAVVPEGTHVPPRTLWAGVPAKLRRELSDADHAKILEYAQDYLDYLEIYLKEPAG